MPSERDKQVVFAMVPGHLSPDGIPFLTFLMSDAAWHYMKDGLGHDFDLVNVGVPLRVQIGRCRSHADGRRMIEEANKRVAEFKDISEIDLGFKKH